VVINALLEFRPSDDATESVRRLYQILCEFAAIPGRARAVPAMFSLLERFPEAEFGSPGPIVHELEAISEYRVALRGSLHRQPTLLTVRKQNTRRGPRNCSEQ
jgi:hypothetical protein